MNIRFKIIQSRAICTTLL